MQLYRGRQDLLKAIRLKGNNLNFLKNDNSWNVLCYKEYVQVIAY
jgi:hypothetical protein